MTLKMTFYGLVGTKAHFVVPVNGTQGGSELWVDQSILQKIHDGANNVLGLDPAEVKTGLDAFWAQHNLP